MNSVLWCSGFNKDLSVFIDSKLNFYHRAITHLLR